MAAKKVLDGKAILINGKTIKQLSKEDVRQHAKETGAEAIKKLIEFKKAELPTPAEVKAYQQKLIKAATEEGERRYTDEQVESMVEEFKKVPKKVSPKTYINRYCIEFFPQHVKGSTSVNDELFDEELLKDLAEAEAKEAKSKK